jgi:hypothetical protein
MRHFKIIPTGIEATFEVFSSDSAAVLVFLDRIKVKQADVWSDGAYQFTASRSATRRSLWTVYENPHLVEFCRVAR